MSKEHKQAEQAIKNKITAGHRRGVCDSEGNSVFDSNGNPSAPQRKMPSTAKTYVHRKGKLVEK